MYSFSRYSLFFLIVSFGFFTSCDKNQSDVFSHYVDSKPVVLDELVACAAKGIRTDIITDSRFVDLYFRTRSGHSNIRYWHSDSYSQQLSDYSEIDGELEYLFSEFMGYVDIEKGVGGLIISFEIEDSLFYSKPIEINWQEPGTVLDTQLNVFTDTPGAPNFQWPESSFDNESIYFLLIADTATDTAISGTYTYENEWRFYDLTNVVFNVTENNNPQLESGTEYFAQLMHVSDNNWVSRIERTTFINP